MFVDGGNRVHFFGGQWIGHGGLEIAQIVLTIYRKRNRHLPTLNGPLDAHDRRMHAQAFGCGDDHRVFDINRILWGAVAVRARR